MSGSGLEFVLDELYASGWTAVDTTDCQSHTDGRLYPGLERIGRELKALGFDLDIKHIQLFDCFRAEWCDEGTNAPMGAVVGSTEIEAAIYALAQVRVSLRVGVNP